MKKRFSDVDKWKEVFFKRLPPAYKLLYIYINDDCDHAGVWQVDMDIAKKRIGMKIDEQTALELFKDKIHVFDNGNKWFLTDFVLFQYKRLNLFDACRKSVYNILVENDLLSFVPEKVTPYGRTKKEIMA